jgi:hypothetical protein
VGPPIGVVLASSKLCGWSEGRVTSSALG